MDNNKSSSPKISQTVVYPINLYKSLQGRYFVGYADNLSFTPGTSAWAGLFNPSDSEVLLHVTVVTITQVSGDAFRAEFWVNAQLPGTGTLSPFVTPANTALQPLPTPKVQLLESSNVTGDPSGGTLINWEQSVLSSTSVVEANGTLVIPPCGSLAIFLVPQTQASPLSTARVALGWWEDPFKKC